MDQFDKTIGARIKQLRLAAGLTQKDFADSIGIVQGFLSALENGKKPPSTTLLLALCHLHQITLGWLRTGCGEMRATITSTESGTGRIPLLRKIAPEFPVLPQEDIASFLSLPELPEGSHAIRFEGDFMAPTILDGDLVIFQSGADVDNRDIVLVTNRWSEVILRRYRLRGDEVYLAAENSSYPPFRPDPQTRIIGKVIAIWRRVKI